MIEGSYEHNFGHHVRLQATHNIKAREARHLNVEKNKVRSLGGDGRNRLFAIFALSNDLDIGNAGEAHHDAPARQLLVINHQRSYHQF